MKKKKSYYGLLYPCNIPTGMLHFKQKCGSNLQENNVKLKLFSEIYWKREYLEFFQHARENDTNISYGCEEKFCQCCPFAKNKICGNSCPMHISEKRNCLLCKEFCSKFNVNHEEIIV